MKVLPNKELTPDQLDLIIENNLYNYGGEAILCRGYTPDTLYKIFFPEDMSENKLRKIEKLYQNEIEYSTRPIATLTVAGILVGYEQSFDQNDISLFDMCLSREEKLHYLRESKKVLDYFASHDITYGDVKSDNILINSETGKVKYCDMDNIRFGQYPIDTMAYELEDYLSNGGEEAKTDAFMHNLMTLEQLQYEGNPQYEILKLIKCKEYQKLPIAARDIIKGMTNPKQFNGQYLIQYIKK